MGKQRRIAIALQIDEPYPQHQEVFAGVRRYARDRPGWRCLIDEHPEYDRKRRGEHYQPYDGVIARASADLQRRLRKLGVPLVNTHFQSSRPGQPGVYVDSHQTGRLAADHLIERGFRRLSIYVDSSHKHSLGITRGFLERAAEARCECSEFSYEEAPYTDPRYWIGLERFLFDWLATLKPPVGLFIELAPIARQLIEASQSLGWNVPQDIAILCHQNLKPVVDVEPQISSIAQNYERLGYEAAAMLERLMDGKAPPKEPVLIPSEGVIARESSDYFAVEDRLVADALLYIAAHLTEPLRVAQIADHLAVSPRSLQLRFDAALGRGISQEVRRLRLEMAKRLLTEPDRPVGVIAAETGFGNAQIMGQVFRRELGTTPTAYRKQALGERHKP